MHLDGGDTHAFDRVQQGYAGMGIGGGVDYDAVTAVVGALYGVHKGAFVIGLNKLRINTKLCCLGTYQLHKIAVGLSAVYFGLADAQHIQIGAVNNQYFHI